MPTLITLTTDFGLDDPFVGIMKGVMLNIASDARLVDITNRIEPQNVLQAAGVLEAAAHYFPDNTVHLVVVDPGVGGHRKPIAARCGTHTFVAPDNGVLTLVLTAESEVYELTETKYFRETVSSTFHGRDIFAPAAAWIANGTSLSDMGKPLPDPVKLNLPKPRLENGILSGEVIYIDRFGNLSTNLSDKILLETFATTTELRVQLGMNKVQGPFLRYSEGKMKEVGALINSRDRLEIFCRNGNAAQKTGSRIGSSVKVSKSG